MRERINRLAKGIIDSEIPILEIRPEQVEETLPGGTRVRGEISVISSNNLHLKGLVYSSNQRVTVANSAFGGLRNRIIYEVNTEYCEHGDIIEGSFYLVTSGGEKEIPYSLRIQAGISGQNLEDLKTPEDFGRLAKKNMSQALEMFEYPDFAQAPFMQDVRCRCIYDGLKGRPDRRNLLEEFLVALGVKEPVSLSVDQQGRSYLDLTGPQEDVIEIFANGWGYMEAQLETESRFIQIPKKQFSYEDFSGGSCKAVIRILPEQMHGGRNFGQIHIKGGRQEFFVPVEAETAGEKSRDYGEPLKADKNSLYRYLSLRLDYETGVYEPALMINQMAREADRLREIYRQDDLVLLIQAELFILSGRPESARQNLEECRDRIAGDRAKHPENYCYYEYLRWKLIPTEGGRQGLVRLLSQYAKQDPLKYEYLFLLLAQMDESLRQNPLELYQQMKALGQMGSRSPFLYAAACRLLEEHKDLLTRLGDFEVQVLYLGARRRMMDREMAERTAVLALGLKHYRRIYERLLSRIYQEFPLPQVLEALCSLLIKGDRRGPQAFEWYRLALEKKINLTRLYEYFLYSLPEDYGRLLPREVLLYFSYDKDLDDASRAVLYQNILEYMDPSQDLYKTYSRMMEQFAMEQLFQSRISSRLALLYSRMIYRDMIDRRAAKVLPELLMSCRIVCRDPRMKYVIVRYEELAQDQAFLLDQKQACVPIFSQQAVILFQDSYGSRYLNVDYEKQPVMDSDRNQELLRQCWEMYPEHPMLRLEECRRILEQGIQEDDQAELVEDVMAQMNLNPVYAQKLSVLVTDYYCSRASRPDASPFNCAYLVQMDKEKLSSSQRRKICGTLISQNYMREAYDMVCRYGSKGLSASLKMRLAAKMILQNLFDQDDTLLELAYEAFSENQYDSVILDYLCEHFNGTVSQMYQILIRAVDDHVETYDLEERLLGQMMFTGSTDQMDSVFDLYTSRKKTRDSVVRAYFTVKCIQYFLEQKEVDGRVFASLEELVNASIEKDRVPTIYLLALSLYYSRKDTLTQEQETLCRLAGGLLIREGLIFPFVRDLSRHMAVPEDIMDKAMIEYRGRKNSRPELTVRILPEEDHFHSEEIHRIYQGIFVMQKVLFQGETMEYRIYDYKESTGTRYLAASGQVCGDHKLDGKENSRFAMLNQMGAALEKKDEEGLKKAMEDYLKKAAVLKELFPTM